MAEWHALILLALLIKVDLILAANRFKINTYTDELRSVSRRCINDVSI